MTTVVETRQDVGSTSAIVRLASPALVLGGIAFFIGGVTHPSDSGEGTKVQQLHDMLVQSSWYPSHAVLLVAMALFAVGILGLRQRPDLSPAMARVLEVTFVIACVATASMAIHLFAALDAQSLADGEQTIVSRVQTVNEAVVDAAWGLAIAVLAVTGGITRSVGNRATIALGLVGGLTFAVASATIAFTDTFDPLFEVASLLSLWAILVGVIAIRRRSRSSSMS
jgi:hypothetical protein